MILLVAFFLRELSFFIFFLIVAFFTLFFDDFIEICGLFSSKTEFFAPDSYSSTS